MATTQQEIRSWLNQGKAEGATHVIVVVDTFDYEDYPVFVKPGENVHDVFAKYHGKNMQRVMEIYALHLDLEAQLNEHRSMHLEQP